MSHTYLLSQESTLPAMMLQRHLIYLPFAKGLQPDASVPQLAYLRELYTSANLTVKCRLKPLGFLTGARDMKALTSYFLMHQRKEHKKTTFLFYFDPSYSSNQQFETGWYWNYSLFSLLLQNEKLMVWLQNLVIKTDPQSSALLDKWYLRSSPFRGLEGGDDMLSFC